jgi:hypothetical protein
MPSSMPRPARRTGTTIGPWRAEFLADHRSYRGFDGVVGDVEIACGFVGFQHDQLADQLAEGVGGGVLISQDGELMLHQRVLQYV